MHGRYIASSSVEPGEHDELLADAEILDPFGDIGVEQEVGIWGSLVALLRCGVGVEERGFDPPNWAQLVGGFGRDILAVDHPLDAVMARSSHGGGRDSVLSFGMRAEAGSGESTTADPEAPYYTLRDLAADAAALADALDRGLAHLAGAGVGGMVARVAVLDHPAAFSALTLVGTRAVAPGKPDADLPDHDEATMKRLFARPMSDWADREVEPVRADGGEQIERVGDAGTAWPAKR